MRMRSIIPLMVIVAVAGIVAFAATAEGQAPLPDFRYSLSDYTPETVDSFDDFPLYSLGTQFENLPLTYITRTFARPQLSAVGGAANNLPDNRTNYLNFIYGTCGDLKSEGGCAPPLTVQVWPACDRTLQDYYYNTIDNAPSRAHERIELRGVPAAKFSDMLEIYSGTVTIVIFGDTEALRQRAAENLSSANILAGEIAGGDPLPAPAAGAVEGTLSR